MLRSEFDAHPLWQVTQTIREQAREAGEAGDPGELPLLERIGFYVDHAESFRAVADTHVALFSTEMLENVRVPFADVAANMLNRLSTGTVHPFVDTAAASAEASLLPMAPWPRPYGKGGQVTQMETLFEDLLERQRQSLAALESQHAALREQIEAYEQTVKSAADEVLQKVATLQQTAAETSGAVQMEKIRIDDVVARGLETVAAVESENDDRYKKWQAERAEAFVEEFGPLKDSISRDLEVANQTLAQLQGTNEQFEKLAALSAGDIVGKHFETEARWGRRVGLWLYAIGFVFIAGAVVPLVWLLFDNPNEPSGAPDWGRIIVRVSIAVLAGSGATVLIRLGARLIANANAGKRMELEMRSFGPFLANVTDTDAVDTARVELLDRAFGRSYAIAESDERDEVVQVSTLAQIADAFSKFGRHSS